VRAYSASSQEAVRARDLLKDWAGEGFLTAEQYKVMEQETVCDLRRTNIFLRLVLIFFTLIIVAAAIALCFSVILSHASTRATGVSLLIFAVISYAAAELAVSQFRLYRYGIEEALAACSVAFLCVGLQFVFFEGGDLHLPNSLQSLVPPRASSPQSGSGIGSVCSMLCSPRCSSSSGFRSTGPRPTRPSTSSSPRSTLPA
jgi:hypothetical protein